MLTVKTFVKSSAINGLGMFAAEKIPKGTITWKYNPRFDIDFDPQEVANMPQDQQDLIKTYAYLSMTSGKYVYSIDNSHFTNHSSKLNNLDVVDCGDRETCAIANRDIEAGEEMLVNYRDFDSADHDSTDEYLKS